MPYRGRLIFPMTVELGLLDTYATATTDPDGPTGPLVSGYDDEFREPVVVGMPGESAPGRMVRVETIVRFKAQVEDDVAGMMEQLASGNSPQNMLGLVFHYQELEAAGAVQTVSGRPIIKAPGARLICIRDPKSGAVIERYDYEPGYWATQAKSMGFGIGLKRNLLLVIFQERDVSVGGNET